MAAMRERAGSCRPVRVASSLAPPRTQQTPRRKYQAPRNEYGQPDLRGVWNFSSDVPLQRPKDTPDKLFRTREDIDKANAARQKQFEQLTQQGVGFHNDFWLDYKSQVEDLRTSLARVSAQRPPAEARRRSHQDRRLGRGLQRRSRHAAGALRLRRHRQGRSGGPRPVRALYRRRTTVRRSHRASTTTICRSSRAAITS